MTDEAPAPVPVTERPQKPIWTRWWMIAIYVVIGIGVIGALGDDSSDPDPVAANSTTTSPLDSTTTSIVEATTTTASEPTSTTSVATTTSTQAQTTQPDPVVLTGSGSEVLEFGPELAWLNETFGIFTYEVSGSGNNAVWGLDSDFETVDLLVNTIGQHTGTRLISFAYDAAGLEVEVNGNWTFTISPPTSVIPPGSAADFNVPVIDTTDTYEGADDAAIDWSGPGVIVLKTDGRVAEISATGDGNIAIWAYSSSGETELLVNEIDAFEGSVLLPDCSEMCWLDIDGDMTYSLSIRP